MLAGLCCSLMVAVGHYDCLPVGCVGFGVNQLLVVVVGGSRTSRMGVSSTAEGSSSGA